MSNDLNDQPVLSLV